MYNSIKQINSLRDMLYGVAFCAAIGIGLAFLYQAPLWILFILGVLVIPFIFIYVSDDLEPDNKAAYVKWRAGRLITWTFKFLRSSDAWVLLIGPIFVGRTVVYKS